MERYQYTIRTRLRQPGGTILTVCSFFRGDNPCLQGFAGMQQGQTAGCGIAGQWDWADPLGSDFEGAEGLHDHRGPERDAIRIHSPPPGVRSGNAGCGKGLRSFSHTGRPVLVSRATGRRLHDCSPGLPEPQRSCAAGRSNPGGDQGVSPAGGFGLSGPPDLRGTCKGEVAASPDPEEGADSDRDGIPGDSLPGRGPAPRNIGDCPSPGVPGCRSVCRGCVVTGSRERQLQHASGTTECKKYQQFQDFSSR